MKLAKDVKPLVKAARKQGWKIEQKARGIRCVPPDKTKPAVTIHGTPSMGKRAVENARADLRRSGLELP